MAVINFGNSLSLKQAARLIAANPRNRFLLEGEPGIGKSSILSMILDELNATRTGADQYVGAYCDVGTMDLGDIAMPAMDHDARVTRYYPNARFRLHEGRPTVIMLDEFSKGADPIKNMLHPLLEYSNPRLGDQLLPEGSIVFLTGNLGSDGVGDTLKAHSRNRITRVRVRKPEASEWIEWGIENGIDPVVLAWVDRFPHALASYTDASQKDNPYIFNPSAVQTAFVTPRSLALASNIVASRACYDSDSLIAATAGTIGEAAARDLQAFVAYQDQMPTWEAIIAKPAKAPVPDSPGACAVLVYGAVTKITDETIVPFMEYIGRMKTEWQAAFILNLAKSNKALAFNNKTCVDWLQGNMDLL